MVKNNRKPDTIFNRTLTSNAHVIFTFGHLGIRTKWNECPKGDSSKNIEAVPRMGYFRPSCHIGNHNNIKTNQSTKQSKVMLQSNGQLWCFHSIEFVCTLQEQEKAKAQITLRLQYLVKICWLFAPSTWRVFSWFEKLNILYHKLYSL